MIIVSLSKGLFKLRELNGEKVSKVMFSTICCQDDTTCTLIYFCTLSIVDQVNGAHLKKDHCPILHEPTHNQRDLPTHDQTEPPTDPSQQMVCCSSVI